MKTVNLLPGWYRQQQRRQKNIRVHLVLMLVIGGAMVGSSFLGLEHQNQLYAQRDALKGRRTQVGDPEPELRRLQARLQQLKELRLARQELGNTIPMSAVVQQVQNDMSPGMALSSVTINVQSEPLRGSGFVGDPHNPPRYHDVAQVSVQGIAPNDVQIAQFIDRLSNQHRQLFSDVTLDYTRTGELQRYSVRKFQIELNMDLERLTAGVPDALASGDTPNGR